VALHDLGGYYFVCRPEKTTLPKVEAFRRWIIAAASVAEAGDESSRPAQQGGERSAP
jgi:hypothetical protein